MSLLNFNVDKISTQSKTGELINTMALSSLTMGLSSIRMHILRIQHIALTDKTKKYSSLLGGLLVFLGLGAVLTLASTTAPYYMSYLQVRADSKSARYANTVFVLNLALVLNALSSIGTGVLKNKFPKFTFKNMHYIAIILLTYVF